MHCADGNCLHRRSALRLFVALCTHVAQDVEAAGAAGISAFCITAGRNMWVHLRLGAELGAQRTRGPEEHGPVVCMLVRAVREHLVGEEPAASAPSLACIVAYVSSRPVAHGYRATIVAPRCT